MKPISIVVMYLLCIIQFFPIRNEIYSNLSDEKAFLVRMPYIQNLTDSQATLRWKTNIPVDGKFLYHEDSIDLHAVRLHVSNESLEHLITLKGLKPNTRYYYSIPDLLKPNKEQYFQTLPSSSSQSKRRVIVLGNSGTGDKGQLSLLKSIESNFDDDLKGFIFLGDNAYPDGTETDYQQHFFDVYNEFFKNRCYWSCVGNHDLYDAKSHITVPDIPLLELSSFPMKGEGGGIPSNSESYYSFDIGDAHFICLDSKNVDLSITGLMYKWLAKDLKASNSKWKIAFFHDSPYSFGSHNSDQDTVQIKVRENFLPLLEKHGVDMTITASNACYERSHLISGHYGSSSTFSESDHIVVSGGNQRNQVYLKDSKTSNACIHTVTGTSGKVSHVKPVPMHPAHKVTHSRLGVLVLDFSYNSLEAKFVDSSGKSLDNYTITKHSVSSDDLTDRHLGSLHNQIEFESITKSDSIPIDIFIRNGESKQLLLRNNNKNAADAYITLQNFGADHYFESNSLLEGLYKSLDSLNKDIQVNINIFDNPILAELKKSEKKLVKEEYPLGIDIKNTFTEYFQENDLVFLGDTIVNDINQISKSIKILKEFKYESDDHFVLESCLKAIPICCDTLLSQRTSSDSLSFEENLDYLVMMCDDVTQILSLKAKTNLAIPIFGDKLLLSSITSSTERDKYFSGVICFKDSTKSKLASEIQGMYGHYYAWKYHKEGKHLEFGENPFYHFFRKFRYNIFAMRGKEIVTNIHSSDLQQNKIVREYPLVTDYEFRSTAEHFIGVEVLGIAEDQYDSQRGNLFSINSEDERIIFENFEKISKEDGKIYFFKTIPLILN